MIDEQLNIIFVDDEQRILDGLRRQLYGHRQKWHMRFALSGTEALGMLLDFPADIVVSDMRMPGMTGGQLFQQILKLHPQTTRIILSGQTDQADLLRDLGCIHQYLQKPCDPLQLCSAIERAHSLSRALRQPALRLAANRITSLPPASEAYQALMAELSKDDADISRVAKTVARDPALTAKLMQLVNSAFFGIPRKTNSPHDAVVLLGLKTVRSIVIGSRLFDFVGEGAAHPEHLTELWNHSFEIGESAGRFAKLDGASESAQHYARLAGLLSFIGRALFLTTEPAKYLDIIDAARRTGRSLSELETEIYGASQDDVTAYAVGLWAFSDEIVAAAACQGAPSSMPNLTPHHPVRYLHLARCSRNSGFQGVNDLLEPDSGLVESNKRVPAVYDERSPAA